MSEGSRKIERLDKVDLVVNDYDWVCPHCGFSNTEMELSVMITTVQCDNCGDNFRINETWE